MYMKRFDMARTLCVFLALISLAGCDLLTGSDESSLVTTGVYVVNQGSFSAGNGTITIYDPASGAASVTAIKDLGSIAQSAYLSGGKLYLTANAANRIDVFDPATNLPAGQIADVLSPRYMAFNGNTAYVTNLYSNDNAFGGMVTVLDLATRTKVKEIGVGNNPEGLTMARGKLFVANHAFGAGQTLSVIDPQTNAVSGSTDVDCDGPRFLVTDEQQEVIAFCTGNIIYDANWIEVGRTNGAIRVIDPATMNVIKKIDLDEQISTADPGQDVFYSPETQTAYFVKGRDTIVRFNTASNTIAGEIGPIEGGPIGAVAYDHTSDLLYVGHVPGFTTSGTVTIHKADGTKTGQFTAGVAPTFIFFNREEK